MVTDTKLAGSKVTDRMAKSTKAKKPKRKQSTNAKSAEGVEGQRRAIENNAQLKTTLQQIEKAVW